MPPRVITRLFLTAAMLSGLLTFSGGSAARGATPREKLPPWTQVKQAVVAQFEALPDYQPGGLIVRSEVQQAGRKFMSQIARYPDAYDRLDRFSRLPRGQRMVGDLIRGPGGYKMIEYMTETPGGEFLGKQLSKAPDGRDFNAPTGRIYTVKMLQSRLKQSYAEAGKAAAQTAVRKTP